MLAHHEVAAAEVEAVVRRTADPFVVVGAGHAEVAVGQPIEATGTPHPTPLTGAPAVQELVGVMAADDRQDRRRPRRRRRAGMREACAAVPYSVRSPVASMKAGARSRSTPSRSMAAMQAANSSGSAMPWPGLSQPVVVVGDHVRVGDMGEAEAVFGAPGLGLQREVHGEARTGVELQLPADERQALPTGRTRPVAVRRRDRQVAVNLRAELQLERAVCGRPGDQLTVGNRYARQPARAIAHAAGGECVVQRGAAGPSGRAFV